MSYINRKRENVKKNGQSREKIRKIRKWIGWRVT